MVRGLFTWAEMFKIKGIIWFGDTAGRQKPLCFPFFSFQMLSLTEVGQFKGCQEYFFSAEAENHKNVH